MTISNTKIKLHQTPDIHSYSVQRDIRFRGYRVILNWNYDTDTNNVVLFKVFKAKTSKPLLEKDYFITQAAAESLSGMYARPTDNNILYDKRIFSKNSKVSIFGEAPASEKQESEITGLEFKEIGFIKSKRKNRNYNFIDRNTKFGETYVYALAAVRKDYLHSMRSKEVLVPIEDIEHPAAPSNVETARSTNGIYFNIKSPPDNDIAYFDIFRKRSDKMDYDFVGRVPSVHNVTKFFDNSVIPGFDYHYKVYSVDFFENVSFSSFRVAGSFISMVERKGTLPPPSFSIRSESGVVIIEGFKNYHDLLGHRIERLDLWKRDSKFSIKTNNAIDWPDVNLFVDGTYTFEDKSTKHGRAYKYRITSISKDESNKSYFISPPIEVKEDAKAVLFTNIKIKPKEKTKLNSFNVSILKAKQDPPVLKVHWKISGPWDHLLIDSGDKQFKIENIHELAYLNYFNRGNTYKVKVIVRDEQEMVLDVMEGVSFKL